MSGPQRTQLGTVATVTPTLTDKAIVSQTNTVKASTFQSIYNLFKTGYDTVYTTTSAVAAQITAALVNYVTNSSLASTLSNYVTNSTFYNGIVTIPQIAHVTITDNEVQQLSINPIQIVDTPGLGKAIQVTSCSVKFTNSALGQFISGLQLQLQVGSGIGNIIALSRQDFLGGVNTSYFQYLILQQDAAKPTNQLIENSEIRLSTAIDPQVDPMNPNLTDVTLEVYIVYQIINL